MKNLSKCQKREKKVKNDALFYIINNHNDLNNVLISVIELVDFKTRRVTAFRKNLIELTELEIKHAKVRMLLFCPNI